MSGEQGLAAPPPRLAWWRRPGREAAAVAAFYGLLTFALFAPVLCGPAGRILSGGGGDLRKQFVGWRAFGFGQMAAGHFPLWNPHIYGGTQYFGGFQSALLYPPNWLYLCLPLPRAVNVGIALHVVLAGWFMYFWVRGRGLHVLAAVTAGGWFMFSGTYFLHIYAGHLPNLCAMVWGPLILLAIDGWCARRTLSSLLLGGGALAMQILAGHPQYVFYTGIAAAAYSATKLWRDPPRWRLAAGLALIPVAGAGLSAVQLFEGLHASAESLRSKGTTMSFAGNFSFPPENLLTLLVPNFFGNVTTWTYWGRHFWWEMCPFFGLSGVVLAVYACVPPRRSGVWVCAGLAVGFFLLALGRYTPLFPLFYRYAPGFDKFRGWSKFIYPATLFLVMLAATGLDALLRRGQAPRALVAVAAAGAVAFFGAGLWTDWSAHQGAATNPQPWDHLLQTLLYSGEAFNTAAIYWQPDACQAVVKHVAQTLYWAAGTTLLLAGAFLASHRWQPALLAVPAVAFAEMIAFAAPTLVTFDFQPGREPSAEVYLAAHPTEGGRVLDLDGPNVGMITGEDDLWGYDPGLTRRYGEFIALTQHVSPDDADQELRFRSTPEIYATLLRGRAAFGLPGKPGLDDPEHAYDDVPTAPHVMLVPSVRVISGRDAVLKAILPPFDPQATVVLESPPVPPPAEHPAPGRAAVVAETSDSLTIEADLPDPAVLVVTDAYSDGWQARSLLRAGEGSGQTRYRVMPADYCVRAVPLSAGHHRFLLAYRPAAFRVGAWVSAVSLLLYAAAWAWLVRGRLADGQRAIIAGG